MHGSARSCIWHSQPQTFAATAAVVQQWHGNKALALQQLMQKLTWAVVGGTPGCPFVAAGILREVPDCSPPACSSKLVHSG